MATIQHTSDGTFQKDVLENATPTLVDFWAPWCMPCRMLGPEIEKFAANNEGKINVVKLNTDENQGVASQMGIQGIPTMILFKNGKEAHRLVGMRDANTLQQELTAFL